jgi:hypothetical protein
MIPIFSGRPIYPGGLSSKQLRRETRLVWSVTILFCLVLVVLDLVFGQSPPPPACETQVSDTYKQLVADRLLPEGAANGPWMQSLADMALQFHVVANQYQNKVQETFVKEGTIARLQEQLRQAQQVIVDLNAQVQKLKAAPPPTN